MKYIPLFLLIQFVNLLLWPIGLVVCLWPAAAKASWIFWNSIDPPIILNWRQAYIWLALRNPVSNLRLIPCVSQPGRPLWHWTNGKYYAQAGWLGTTGFPVLSAGSGKGY